MPTPQLHIELCQPTEGDAQQVMAWRNDPQTLAMSFHHEPKTWPAYFDEYRERYVSDLRYPAIFLRDDHTRVGFVSFSRIEAAPCGTTVVDISIIVAPSARGRGIASAGLKLAADYAKTLGVQRIVAEVRIENEASSKAFVRAGFLHLDSIDKVVADTQERCRIHRYVFHVAPSFWTSKPVFIIAEAGSNWRMGSAKRDLTMAKALIDVAVESGADAVKFQTYRAETVYVPNAGASDYLSQSGITEDINSIFADAAMPYEMIGALSHYCQQVGIQFMSTAFSIQDFAAIDPFVSVHKIASYEISHLRLLELTARTGKPTILSTGASTVSDVSWAVQTLTDNGCGDLCLMQCTAKYPAPLPSLNLDVLPYLARRYGVATGLSDHSRHPVYGPATAVALGARCIEKHYTLSNRLPGADHAFALTPDELKEMVQSIRAVEQTLGSGIKTVLDDEKELAAYARRGLQATRNIAAGEPLREGENIAILRPGSQRLGIHPRYLSHLEGKRAKRAIALGDGILRSDWDA